MPTRRLVTCIQEQILCPRKIGAIDRCLEPISQCFFYELYIIASTGGHALYSVSLHRIGPLETQS